MFTLQLFLYKPVNWRLTNWHILVKSFSFVYTATFPAHKLTTKRDTWRLTLERKHTSVLSVTILSFIVRSWKITCGPIQEMFDQCAHSCALPHQAGIELSDFHARGWKSDQGGRNSMQEMHGNQTKCMEFRPIKENSNFWTSIFCPGINFSCSKSLWIWWTIDPLILVCLKLMTYASFSTKELLAVLTDGNPCTNGWNSMHQNRKNVIASCFFEQSCLRQVKIQDPWQI